MTCRTCEGTGQIYDQTVTRGDSQTLPCPACIGGCPECDERYKDHPKVPRPGTELVAYSPEPVVGLLEFRGTVYCATAGGVWRMVKDAEGKDHFEPVPFAPERLGIE